MFIYPGGEELFKMLFINVVVPIEAISRSLTATNVTRGGFIMKYFKKLHLTSHSIFALANGCWSHCASRAPSYNFTFTSNEIQ